MGTIYNKLIAGGTPKKTDLKKETKRRRTINNKLKNARSTLETDGGAANVKGAPINNAFFNRSMGSHTDTTDFTPSSTGLATDGASSGSSGEGAGDAGAGAAAGGAGGE